MNNRSATKILSILVSVVFISLILPGCHSKKQPEQKAPPLKVMQIKGKRLPIYLDLVGQPTGIPTVEIRARVVG